MMRLRVRNVYVKAVRVLGIIRMLVNRSRGVIF